MKVAQLTIEMAANVARLQKDMAAAQRSVESTMGRIQKSADSAMRALGALGVGLSVGAFATWIKGAIDAIDKLNDISAATGITVTKLAGLDYAAKLSGTNLEAVTQASNKLQLSLTTNNAALTRVGISAQDPIEALAQLADVYSQTEGQSNKAAVASLALGKSWQSIAGLLAQGGDALRNLIAEGEALSGVTQETANDAAKFNDEMDKLSTRLGALALNIAVPLLKVFSEFIDELNEGTKAAGGFWKAIGMFGTTNPFLSLEENVAKYRKEVEELTEKQSKQNELANLAFGTNEKLATATQRLAYFEAMLAIEARNAAAALAEGASGANAHVGAYSAMIAAADDLIEQMEIEFSLIGLTNEERAVSIAMRKLEEIGIRQGTEAFEKYMKEIIDIQKRIGIKKEMVRLSEDAAKNAKREAEEYDRLLKSFQDQIAVMQIENENYFIGNAARERAIFLRDTENLKIEDRSRLLAQYDEAAAIKAANEQRKKGIEKQIKQQEDYAKEMEKINDQIGQSLTDALMEGGMNARDFIVNMFKTMVLRPVLQPLITGVVGAIGIGGAGAALAGGGGAAGASSMTQASGLLGLVSAAKTAYQFVTGGFEAIGSMASTVVSTFEVASTYGTGLLSQQTAMLAAQEAGMSTFSAAAGSAAQYLAGIGAGVMAGQMISGQYKVGGSSYLTTGAGAIIGAIVGGPLGAAIGGAIGGVINRAFGMAPKETTSAGYELTLAVTGAIATGFEKWEQKGGWFRSSKSGKELTTVAQETVDFFSQTSMAVGSSIAGMAQMFGASIDTINNFKLDIVIETLNATKEQIQEQITGAFAFMETSLVDYLIPSIYEFAAAGDKTAADILKRLTTSITTVNQAFDILGYNLYEISLQGAAASYKLVEMFGGFENFTKATSFYYENFYSMQEKVNYQTEQMTKIFEALGKELPNTKDQFRALVEAAQASGDNQLFATLMQLAPAFNNLQTSMQQLQGSTENTTDAVREAAEAQKQLASNYKFFFENFFSLQEQTSKQSSDLIKTFTELGQELPATKEAFRALVESVEAAGNKELVASLLRLAPEFLSLQNNLASLSEAVDDTTNSIGDSVRDLEAIAQQRFQLETQLLQLQNNTLELRRRELEQIDESNKGLQEQIWQAQDQNELDRERIQLENKLLDLQGNTTELRKRELEVLNPANRALQEQIWAMQDSAAASKSAADAAREAAAAEEERRRQQEEAAEALAQAAQKAYENAIASTDQAFSNLSETLEFELNKQLEALEFKLKVVVDGMTGAINQLTSGIERLQTASGNTDFAFNRIKEAVDRETQLKISAANRQFDAQKAAVESQISAQESVKDAASKIVDEIKNLFDTLKSSIADLASDAQMAAMTQAAMQIISGAVASSRAGGGIGNISMLKEAIGIATSGVSSATYNSAFESERANALLRNQLIELQGYTSGQLTIAERQLIAAESQVEALRNQLDSIERLREQTIARLEKQAENQIEQFQEQIDEARGLHETTLSMSEMIEEFNSALLIEQQYANELQEMISSEEKIDRELMIKLAEDQIKYLQDQITLAETQHQADVDAANAYRDDTLSYYQEQINLLRGIETGIGSIPEAISNLKSAIASERNQATASQSPVEEQIRGFMNGGYYDGGMALVGEAGPELINFGAPGMVYSNNQLKNAFSGGGETASEVRALREENRIQARSMVALQAKMTRLLERWDGDGLPEERVVTA